MVGLLMLFLIFAAIAGALGLIALILGSIIAPILFGAFLFLLMIFLIIQFLSQPPSV